MENAAYTFELLLQKVIQDRPEQAASAMEKAKHRVLKVRPHRPPGGAVTHHITSRVHGVCRERSGIGTSRR